MYIEPHPMPRPGPPPLLVEPALEALLARSAMQVDVVAELHKCGTWYADAPRYASGLFHLVGSGACIVESEALDGPVSLAEGDLVIFPHGAPHRLRGHLDGDGCASLICGEFRFAGAAQHPLNLALPEVVIIRATEASESFRQLSATMAEMVHADGVGRHVVLSKLADALFTLAICHYARTTEHRRGLFASLSDPRIARVLHAIHDNPGHAWTMQSMASLACMSRSAFAERFTQLLRQPPIQYLTQWRVTVAGQLLRDRQQSVAGIAQQLGYSSEAAFRRLFKRVSGVCPGSVRGEVAAMLN